MLRCKFSPASNKLVSATMSFDTGAVLSQLRAVRGKGDALDAAASAAQVAATQADAILDSLQMPRFSAPVPSAVTVVPSSSSVESGSADKGESGDDESDSDSNANEKEKEGDGRMAVAAATAG